MGGRSGQALSQNAKSPNAVSESNNVAPKNETPTYKNASVRFSGIKKDEAIKLASVVGIPNDFQGEIVVTKFSNKDTLIYVSNKDITMSRTIDETTKTIHNDLFVVKKSATGSKKYDGSDIFTEQVAAARKAGYNKIVTEAASGTAANGTKFNGYYTWLRLGYKPTSPSVNQKFVTKFNTQTGGNIKNISDLMHTEAGRSWWKKNGKTFKAEFDLSANSDSSKTLNSYNKK